MAAYVPVPRDLTRIKTKVLFGLTKRQLICFSLAALIGVPSYFFIKGVTNASAGSLCMIVIMLPLFILALYEKDGMPLEVMLWHYYEWKIRRPLNRPYLTINYYTALERQAKLYEEVSDIVSQISKESL